MNETDRQVLKDAVSMWGRDAQAMMLVEETGELLHALARSYRCHSDEEATQRKAGLIEEIADVQVLLDQFKLILGESAVQEQYEKKLARLRGKLQVYKEAREKEEKRLDLDKFM